MTTADDSITSNNTVKQTGLVDTLQLQETSIDPEITIEQGDLDLPHSENVPRLKGQDSKLAKKCQICKKDDWIYTCPRCLFHTCSVQCVKQHKTESSCSGIRDKTAYVSLQKYTESHMMSDYTYLEDVSRHSDNLTRSRLNTTKNAKTKVAEQRSRFFAKSVNQMSIKFSSLPIGMSRHKINQSNYSKNLRQIFWSIEINFCRNNGKERYLEHSFPGSKPFGSFFDNLLFSPTPQGRGSYQTMRHQLQDFITAGLDHFTIALKKENSPAGYFVDVTSCLDNPFNNVLRNETIIEYPIFYVWLTENGAPEFVRSLEEKKHWITTVSADVKKDAIEPDIGESSQEEEDENMNEAETHITEEDMEQSDEDDTKA